MAENKIKYGLSNVHYAVLTDESTLTYDNPKPIKGAVNLSLSAEGETSTFYADNIAYFTTNSNNGYSGDLEIALIPDEFYTDVLGYEKDSTSGMLVEIANAVPKTIALLFQFELDKSKRKTVLFKVTVGRPSLEHATKNESLEPQTDTLPITVLPVQQGEKVFTKGVSETGTPAYDAFFTAVKKPTLEV